MSTSVMRRQHLNALARANEIRLARATLKHRIARGEIPVTDVILNPPAEAETWPIMDVLQSQRGWGRERSFRLLRRAGVHEGKAVGVLTERQRVKLATFLGYRVNGAIEGRVGNGS